MTIKKQIKIKKIPIYVFFHKKQIPNDVTSSFYEFPKNFIQKKQDKIYVFLDQIEYLSRLQKNYFLIFVGTMLNKFCKVGNFFIEYFGDSKTNKNNIYLGWALADYSFNKFKIKKEEKKRPKLINNNKKQIEVEKNVYFFVRNLINTPANILGPREIFIESKTYLGKSFASKVFSGKSLKEEFPLIYAVGRGASKDKQPLLCEIKPKKIKSKNKVILIGKGVSFDTGGLNIKSGVGMSLMKKDMGGAANCIGLTKLIHSHNLNIDYTLLLCLVENSISKNSMRPSDIFKSRSGSFIEVIDTDAEGRLIMADAISYACESKPDLIIDMSTLTGASRVALGTDVPSFFCNDDNLSMELIKASKEVGDPLWQLPLWQNYSNQLNSLHADYRNLGSGAFGGAITAALFLEKFVKLKIPWIHVDLMAWSKPNKLCDYEGGEAMGIRALIQLIKNKFN